MNFGENLKKIRKLKKMSQEDLADKVNVSRQSVSKWETGDAYPEMNNILQLCKIFKCKINDLVHSNMEDFNSLDKDIIMKVVKFNEDEQNKIKGLSKLLYVLGRIGKIVSRVGICIIVFIMIMFSVLFSNIEFKDNTIIEKGNIIKINKLDNNTIRFSLQGNEDVVITDFEEDEVEKFEKIISKMSLSSFIIYFDGGLLLIAICLLLTNFVFGHFEKLFMNIYDGETPFTMDNVKHIKKMVYFMIGCIISSSLGSFLLSTALGSESISDFTMYNITEILFLYAIAYIFEYGYKIQKDSKGVMYN